MKRLFLLCMTLTSLAAAQRPAYKDPSLPVEARVNDLMSRMTLEEQAAQLYGYFSIDTLAFDQDGNFVGTRDTAALSGGVGSYGSRLLYGRMSALERARCINGIQRYMTQKTRLGIPVFVFGESLHGFMAQGATSFPQAIALGCTWDTLLVEQVFRASAREATARGTHQVLSPVLDLARDPRWGRTEECYSEDPYLVSRMGMAAVFGFQGRAQVIDSTHVAVTLKHFAGHGQPEGGRNIAPVNYSEREFRENHLYPFEMAVKRAHARSLMASYNEWDGVPNHVNRKLLYDILRTEWGFNGYVMSDGGGMDVTYREHHAAAGPRDSGILSVEAGIDYELGSGMCFDSLAAEARQGIVSADAIRRAATAILRVKFECGLFDASYASVEDLRQGAGAEEHKVLARRAAQEAMVLLKNEGRTLPFRVSKVKTLALIGPNAADIHLGGYTAPPMVGVSILDGLQEFARGKFKVVYAKGCTLTLNKECHWLVNENPILGDPKTDDRLIAEALRVAKKADAVVLALGENELICREAWAEFHKGDRDDLDLVGRQEKLAEEVLKLGKPTVICLINGRPITIRELSRKAPAIVECWYLGQETGRAVADMLFGNIAPSGKLTVTIPQSVGQLPCYYDRKPSRFRSYVLDDSLPLYPFGFGLSYTTFAYTHLHVSPRSIGPDGSAEVSVEVSNSGSVKADEIVQLYIRDEVSLPTRPVQELKDFARITLDAGEKRIVTFMLTPEKLQSIGLDMKRRVPPGRYDIMVGRSSADVLTDTLVVARAAM
ncbi:MAG TPA: glycoside hydrolase family 3 N-terminal domain-containing protein [Bacteroidota bacterium]|nr:glycoside hydrolase family 3 N-terminal domain-containing protein [Bacteroidota bacterium]